jgi:hypothetical protein
MKKLAEIQTDTEMREEFARVALGDFETRFPEAIAAMKKNQISVEDSHVLYKYSKESLENNLALLLHMSRYLRYESLMGSGAVVQLCDIAEKVYVEQPNVASAFSECVIGFLNDNQPAQNHFIKFATAYELAKARIAGKFTLPEPSGNERH